MRKLLFASSVTVFGLGVGVVVGIVLMRRVDRAATAMKPTNLADRGARAAFTVRDRIVGALDEGARVAAEREAQLRAEYVVPTFEETLGAVERTPPRRG